MSETTNAEGAPAKQQPAATAPNRGVNHKTRSKAWKLNNQTANGQVSSPQQQQQSTPQQHQQQAAAKQNPPATRYNDNAKNTRKPKTAHNRRNQPAQPAVTDQLVVDVLNFLQHCDWRQPPAQMFRQLMELMQRPDAQTFSMLEAVRHDLQHVLHARFASNEVWRIHPFGSAISTLSFRDSDFDILIHLPPSTFTDADCAKNQLIGRIQSLAKVMRSQRTFGQVIAITSARVPIIKSWHFGTNTACDFSFCYNFFSVQNTFVVRYLVNCNARIKPLTLLLKFWFRRHDYLGTGKFTSYCLFQLIVFYLQRLPEPMLPPLEYFQQSVPVHMVDGWNVAFDFERPLPITRNTASLMELVSGFFAFYREMDFEQVVICTLTAQTYPRSAFSAAAAGRQCQGQSLYTLAVQAELCAPLIVTRPLCVQDPFTLNINVGTVANVVFAQFQKHLHLMQPDSAAALPPSGDGHTAAVASTLLRLCRLQPAMVGKQKYDSFELVPTKDELDMCARRFTALLFDTATAGAQQKAVLRTVWKACAMHFVRIMLVELCGGRLEALPKTASQVLLARLLRNRANKRLNKKELAKMAKAAADGASKQPPMAVPSAAAPASGGQQTAEASSNVGAKESATPEPKASAPEPAEEVQRTQTPTKRHSTGEAVLDGGDSTDQEQATSTAAAAGAGDDDEDGDDDDDADADEETAADQNAAAGGTATKVVDARADTTIQATPLTQACHVFVEHNLMDRPSHIRKNNNLRDERMMSQLLLNMVREQQNGPSHGVHFGLGMCGASERNGLLLLFQYNQTKAPPANRAIAKSVAAEQLQQAAEEAFASYQLMQSLLAWLRNFVRKQLRWYFDALDSDEVQVQLSDDVAAAVRFVLAGEKGNAASTDTATLAEQ